MDKIVYTQEKMDAVKTQVQKLVAGSRVPWKTLYPGWTSGRKYRRSDGCILLWN